MPKLNSIREGPLFEKKGNPTFRPICACIPLCIWKGAPMRAFVRVKSKKKNRSSNPSLESRLGFFPSHIAKASRYLTYSFGRVIIHLRYRESFPLWTARGTVWTSSSRPRLATFAAPTSTLTRLRRCARVWARRSGRFSRPKSGPRSSSRICWMPRFLEWRDWLGDRPLMLHY